MLQYYLFDLINDPYETTNLYDSSDEMKAVQSELYAQLDVYTAKAARGPPLVKCESCESVWAANDNYVVPWEEAEAVHIVRNTNGDDVTYPTNCGKYSAAAAFGSAKAATTMEAGQSAPAAATSAAAAALSKDPSVLKLNGGGDAGVEVVNIKTDSSVRPLIKSKSIGGKK
jgi:hypothetical protein